MRTAILTLLALIAFAANSILCRKALEDGAIDAASFSTVRLVAGAATLLAITKLTRRRDAATLQRSGGWTSALLLFLYAIPFSYAYLELGAGTGALVLFASVQLTMTGWGIRSGERPSAAAWLGLVVAGAGLVYLVSPDLVSPSSFGFALMGTAGVAWGAYSLRGRSAEDPLAATTTAFVRSVPFVLAVNLAAWSSIRASGSGVAWAAASGSLASACGYVAWYAAVRRLTAVRAAVVQLAVPVIAALGGVAVLGESVTARLSVAGALILGGIGLSLTRRRD